MDALADLRGLAHLVRYNDAVDVLFCAALTYTALEWARRARAKTALLFGASVVVVHALAVVFGLSLTATLFRSLLTIALLALVVLFQAELRRGLETALSWPRSRPSAGEATSAIEVVASTCGRLAATRTGALLVFEGREPLSRHLAGGVRLDAFPSGALLESLFDTSSPGHDGAVIVRGARAVRFGVHLPLSSSIRGNEGYGTRHSAALGLSELSDALIIAVSEERGTVSVARSGELHVVSSVAELRSLLVQFHRDLSPPPVHRRGLRLVTRRVPLVLASLALPFAGWLPLFLERTDTATRSVEVPVLLAGVPAAFRVGAPSPDHAHVTLFGPRAELTQLGPSEVSIVIDGSQLAEGLQRLPLTTAEVRAPRELSVRSVEPGAIEVSAERTVVLELPVEVTTSGRLPGGWVVASASAVPGKLPWVVPARLAGDLVAIPARPVSLTGLTASVSVERDLLPPKGVEPAPGAARTVVVRVNVLPTPPLLPPRDEPADEPPPRLAP